MASSKPRRSYPAIMSTTEITGTPFDRRHAVEREKWRLFRRNLPLALFGNVLSAVLLAVVLWWHLGGWVMFAWAGGISVLSLARWQAVRRLTLDAFTDPARPWPRRLTLAGNLLGGLMWGLGCWWLLPWGATELQAVAAVFLAGLAAGSLGAAVAVLPAFLLFLFGLSVPVVAHLALHLTNPQLVIAVAACGFTAIFAGIGRNLNRQITHSITMRFTNARLLEELAHARDRAEEASRAKSEFLAGMSHELRTPLNAVLGFSQSIEQTLFGPVGDPRYVEYARDIRESGEHLLALINDVLDISRIDAGYFTLQPEPCDLAGVARSSLRALAQSASRQDVTMEIAVGDGVEPIAADSRAMKQIFLNLLSNAIKFTPAGGRISILLRSEDTGGVSIAVSDTGVGVAAEDRDRIFEPFQQGAAARGQHSGGVGLGLALSKHLVELHGGALTLDSVEGEGSTVTVFLPGAACEGGGDDAPCRPLRAPKTKDKSPAMLSAAF